eukprot:9103895-Pyramimonas_sp.AAC.1
MGSQPGALEALVRLCKSCEEALMWPEQTLLRVIALLPKSKTDERPVCQCPTRCRVYTKIRGAFSDVRGRDHA